MIIIYRYLHQTVIGVFEFILSRCLKKTKNSADVYKREHEKQRYFNMKCEEIK